MKRFSIVLLALALTPSAVGLAGCGTPCDASHQCVLDTSQALCDGTSYVACSDSNRNEEVTCVGTTPRKAVCTPSGWSFETP